MKIQGLSLVQILFVKKKNPLQDLLSSMNAAISTNEKVWILTSHVIFKLRYNQIYQLKTTHEIIGEFGITVYVVTVM